MQAEGNTPHALAFTALDLGSWLFARSTQRGYSELNCFIVRFDIVEGVADTETLFLDTDNVQLFGDGDIDLEPESISLDMDPRAKTRRIANLTTRFSIEGTLTRPRVNVSAGGAAVRTIGEIALTPVNLLGRLLPFVNDRGDDADNPCVSVEIADPAP